MRQPAAIKTEMAEKLEAMSATVQKVETALAGMATTAKEITDNTEAIVSELEDWDLMVRKHGERIGVKDTKAGTVVDLSRDQLFVGLGGGDIEAGALYLNMAHDLPGGGDFRPATELEVRAIKGRLGEGRVDAVMQAGEQIGR